ncbi:MAG: glycosyltransferase family 4 protein [Rhodopila sp.]|nr:glycosyltransferase family 4 protein [Rhodopila sp.]
MNILFIHQNMPGQFRHLVRRLVSDGAHRVVCIGRRKDFAVPGAGRVVYDLPPAAIGPNLFLTPMETGVRHGIQVARACEILAKKGFRPDLIVAHPGWGESLYIKEVFPLAPLVHYCEYFYRSHGADTNFDPADQQDLEANCVTRTRNAHLLLGLDACDWGVSPTFWQKQQHPAAFHSRISVRFDGIDTDAASPDRSATFTLPNGRVLSAGDEVVTYVARGLEPYRGFPSFMRALPEILRRRPAAQILIAGSDEVSYGKPPPDGGSWRAAMLAEVSVDPARVHFLGPIAYTDYLRLLQVSAVHVYLTVPFVLSWSMLEAMAAGCLVVGSATPPVQEVIEDGRNGLLADFFSPAMIAARVVAGLEHAPLYAPLRQAARWTALSRYSLERCLPRQIALLETVASGGSPALE